MAWAGLAAGVGTLMALSLPPTLTRVMLVRAASDDPAISRSGITWLRRIGQRDLMLRAATGRAHGAFDLLGAVSTWSRRSRTTRRARSTTG